MNRRTAILLLVVLAITLLAAATFTLLPKRYQLSEHMLQTVAFWHDDEAFVFLTLQVTGRSTNFIQEKLSHTYFGAPFMLLGWNEMFYKQDVIAYHLLPTGKLDRFALPENSAVSGLWSLTDGKLQLTPGPSMEEQRIGFRWDGEKFAPISPSAKLQAGGADAVDSQLSEDDLGDEETNYPRFIEKSEREKFHKAGWHVKALNGYEGRGKGAVLPMNLGRSAFRLVLRSFPLSSGAFEFNTLTMGAQSIEISGQNSGQPANVLWKQADWKEIPKSEYQALARQYGRRTRVPAIPWFWLVALLGLLIWRFAHWGSLIFSLGGAKRRILSNLPTSYSFPPVSPGQFPMLDSVALDRYTREFENLGFIRLADLSLVGDTSNSMPNFCRAMAHTRHHCFAEIVQFFPQRKAAMPLKCSIQSCLQDGWTIAFSDRKPQAAGSLVRRPKAIGVCMPEASPAELLQSFLRMRDQMCLDLGISSTKDDSLEGYIGKVQRAAGEMREAVQRKNLAVGLSHVYYRKLSLLKARPEYMWLGDYPKLAEKRKQGYAVAYDAKN